MSSSRVSAESEIKFKAWMLVCSLTTLVSPIPSFMIKVNVQGTTKVTQAVLPGMIQRKKGAIVNIGSGAAIVIPSDPLYAVYAATKAYVDQFSRCLYVEYKKSGIDVLCQVPLYVATKMASIKRSSFFVPSTDGYAKAAMQWIGYEPRCTALLAPFSSVGFALFFT